MPIHLGEVLFPLRYDVYDQAPALKKLYEKYKGNMVRMMEAGGDSAIHRSLVIGDPVYQAIGMLKLHEGAELDRRIERYYGARMTKLTTYYRSIGEKWDKSSHKIFYKRIENPTLTTAGNPVPDGLFLADGQHRTITLLALGHVVLPDYVADIEVKLGTDFKPLDMTWAYIKAGACTERQFVDFARFRFVNIPEEVVNVKGLSDWADHKKLYWLCAYIKLYWR